MNRCKDCKYWRQHGIKVLYPHGRCYHNKIIWVEYRAKAAGELFPDGVLLRGECGYEDTLITGEEFGCVHWEHKEGPNITAHSLEEAFDDNPPEEPIDANPEAALH